MNHGRDDDGLRSLIFKDGNFRSGWGKKRLASKSDINPSHTRTSRLAEYVSTSLGILKMVGCPDNANG